MAPINSDPSFTVAATPGAVGNSRWLAPEIITPTRKENGVPVVESKAADVFAFGMLAVEVFTGKIPFEEQENEAVVLRISQGGRPKMPDNAQAVGLTDEIWHLIESCWQQNPENRPTMNDVVGRLWKFDDDSDVAPLRVKLTMEDALRGLWDDDDDDDSNVATGCVRITLVIPSSSSVPFSTSVIDPGNRHPLCVPDPGVG